jgi:hypothetical protein
MPILKDYLQNLEKEKKVLDMRGSSNKFESKIINILSFLIESKFKSRSELNNIFYQDSKNGYFKKGIKFAEKGYFNTEFLRVKFKIHKSQYGAFFRILHKTQLIDKIEKEPNIYYGISYSFVKMGIERYKEILDKSKYV